MKTKLLYLLLVSFLVSNFTLAQKENFRTSTLDKSSNYFDIVNKKRKELEPLKGKTDRKSKKQIKQFERWAAFWKDRIMADGSFLSEAHTFNELEKEKKRKSQSHQRNTQGTVSWSLVGPSTPPVSNIGFYPGMGRINTVAFNGTDTNTMYIGSPGGGIWKTTNGGASWVSKGDELPNIGVSHIVINPTNSNTLYLASGDSDGFQNRSLGVFKSTDSGDNWSTTGLRFTLGDNNIISKLLIDPNNVNIVLATTRNSIKRTIDGGASWLDVYIEDGATFNDIAYKYGSNAIIYATSRLGKFYISTDKGVSWTVASTPSSDRLDIALTANDVEQILTIDSSGVVKKSTDQGTSWTTVSTIANYSSQGGYNMTFAVSPLDKNLVLAGGIEGWRSKDGGATWEKYLDGYWQIGQPYFYVHSDHHDMLFVPGTSTAFSVNDGGIFKGDAALDNTWTDLSSGLAITQYYSVSGTPQNTNFLIMGAQDNDIAVYNGTTFTAQNPGSDGVEGLWDYSNSNIAWTCSQEGGMNRTIDGFTSSQNVTTPEGAPFVWELEIHPTVPTTIFGGFDDIYKSTDRGDNWTNLSSGIGTIEYISISSSNADVIYISGENQTVKRTENGGTSWSDVTLPQAGSVKSIEVHPTNPAEVYIAYSGYSTGKVYKSIDSGANWTDITGSLPNIPTHQIRYKTGSTDGELFLATDLGVYYRTNTVGDWVKLDAGLPNVIVYDIEIHYGTEKLRAATFGRGVWEASITASALGIEKYQLPENIANLYPNPTENKIFTIKLNALKGDSNITIYNVIGGVVKDFKTSKSEEKVDLNQFSKGLYFVSISNNGKSLVKKIIVK